jgi:hypothetical protein
MNKKPWIAAILNLVTFGGGYIYNGKRIGFGTALIVGLVLVRAGEIPIYLTHLVFEKWIVLMTGLVVLQLTLTVDAYNEAKTINANAK